MTTPPRPTPRPVRVAAGAVWLAFGCLVAVAAIVFGTDIVRNLVIGGIAVVVGVALLLIRIARRPVETALVVSFLIVGLVLLGAASYRVFGERLPVFG